jgi:hypothetical protein
MGFEPVGQQDEVFDRGPARFHAINQVPEQGRWQILAAYFWLILCPPQNRTGSWQTRNVNSRKSRG